MLQKNKCCCEDNSFEKSERIFKDKMNTWTCECDHDKDDHIDPQPDHTCNDMTLAMPYVKNQTLNMRTLKNCKDALTAGTLFEELDMPFTGGHRND